MLLLLCEEVRAWYDPASLTVIGHHARYMLAALLDNILKEEGRGAHPYFELSVVYTVT